jgi:hypothetical protein
MSTIEALVAPAPGKGVAGKAKTAALRALRTFIQGVAAALVTGAAGTAIATIGYWEMVGIAVIGAAITALARSCRT